MGFDVWIDNARGTSASLGHTTLNYVVNADLYWNWTFADTGKTDLPAITDLIIKERFAD
jgi:hypothetical protein